MRGLAQASALSAALALCACSGKLIRPYFSRSAGGYVDPKSTTPTTTTAMASANLPLPATSGDLAKLRKVAESYLGVPYRYGAQGRSGMDCSGFVRQVFSETYGMNLPHNAYQVSRMGKAVSKKDLQPGDLLFFKGTSWVDHIGIYMGNGYFIHAATSSGVSYSTLDAPYFGTHYASARRILIPLGPE